MSDHYYFQPVDECCHLPSLFALDMSILLKNRIWIPKGILGQREIDVVLGVVDPVLILIPFEPHALPPSRNYNNVTTKL